MSLPLAAGTVQWTSHLAKGSWWIRLSPTRWAIPPNIVWDHTLTILTPNLPFPPRRFPVVSSSNLLFLPGKFSSTSALVGSLIKFNLFYLFIQGHIRIPLLRSNNPNSTTTTWEVDPHNLGSPFVECRSVSPFRYFLGTPARSPQRTRHMSILIQLQLLAAQYLTQFPAYLRILGWLGGRSTFELSELETMASSTFRSRPKHRYVLTLSSPTSLLELLRPWAIVG